MTLKKRTQNDYSRNDRDGAKVWIKVALEIISRDGVDTLKVGKLVQETGVSKGSFYWFFDDMRDLLMCSLNYWKVELNNAVFDHIRSMDGSVKQRMFALIDMVFESKLGRHDAAIRAWALKDPEVNVVVKGVDHDRLAFLSDLFSRCGMDPALSEQQAHLLYRAIIAESYLSEYPSNSEKDAYLKDLIEILLEKT